jgi:4-amino-4-deoxy-L-arabinose transferase-like glycosyltransferase
VGGDLSARAAAVLLALVVLFSLGVNGWFIAADQRPANINELSHIMGAIDFLNLATQRPSLYGAYLEAFNGYPPIGAVTTAFYAVFGRTHDVAAAGQLPFNVLLLIAVYLIGARLAGRKTGLVAAWLTASSPAIVELSRQYLLELPLTALSAWAVYLLLASDRFTSRRLSVAAGLAVGLAALSKQTFFLFLLGPVLFMLPGWIAAIREDTAPAQNPSPRRRALVLAGLAVGALVLSWLVYGRHASTIENWFAAYPEYQLPYGMIFFAATALLVFAAGVLATGPATPLRNGLLAATLAVLVASLWYFPKGVLNFVTYLGQMQLNVERSGMSPATLLSFYRAHATTYYLGLTTWLALGGAAALLAVFLATRRWLARWFFLRELTPPPRLLALAGLWFGVPFAAFFFISIQNEMNTVPIVPSLALLAAVLITRVRLPYAAKTRKAIEAGRLQLAPRVIRGALGLFQAALILLLVGGGVLMAMPWPDGADGYQPLPGALNAKPVIDGAFHRKVDPIAYLVPLTADWHEREIAEALFGSLPEVRAGDPPPRVLAMDVEFYFSWNTFWYMAKLMNKQVEIRTPWYADADILDPASPDYVETFDRILFRSAFDKVYHEEKIRNDYQSYRYLLAAYEFLQEPPPEFAARFPLAGAFVLPDNTTAMVLRHDIVK